LNKQPDPDTYRAPNGRFLTESLFWETSRDRTAYPPVFTLKPVEHMGVPSLKALYLEARDPTEYRFATTVLGSYEHWRVLCSLAWFTPHIESWREELDLLIRQEAADAAREVMSNSESSPAAKMSAAKFLSERGWERKTTRGRPSKGEVAREARRLAEKSEHVNEDYKRILT